MRRVDEENTKARHKHILMAAMRCFSRTGLQRTSVQDICREAGMTSGHLYYYFSSKTAITEALFEVGTRDFVEKIEHMLDQYEIGEAVLNVHHQAEAARHEWAMSPGLRLEFFAEAARNPDLRSIQQELNERLLAAVRAAIRAGIASKKVAASVNVDDLTNAIFLLWTGLGELRADTTLDMPDFERAVRMLLDPWLPSRATAKGRPRARAG